MILQKLRKMLSTSNIGDRLSISQDYARHLINWYGWKEVQHFDNFNMISDVIKECKWYFFEKMDEDIKESFSDGISECNTEIEDIEYIRMCQAVKKYDITRQTLYNWIKEWKMKAIKISNSHYCNENDLILNLTSKSKFVTIRDNITITDWDIKWIEEFKEVLRKEFLEESDLLAE